MTVGAKGLSLELFFVDGRPDGMVTAEVFNWTGQILLMPRTQFSDALKRKETGYTGIYILFGEQNGMPIAYIGESDNLGDRIYNHDLNKDWWESAILITSTGNKLNKAHIRYLEARLIGLAKSINKISLDNETEPSAHGLTEVAQANMESFLENILMVLPALRIDSFVESTRPEPSYISNGEPTSRVYLFELRVPSRQIYATAKLADGEFVVQKGSVIAKTWDSPGYENTTYARLYEELVKIGRIQEQGEHRVFTDNHAFTSVSAAASVINGHPTSGPLVWKIKGQEKTYKKWEAEMLAN